MIPEVETLRLRWGVFGTPSTLSDIEMMLFDGVFSEGTTK